MVSTEGDKIKRERERAREKERRREGGRKEERIC